MFGADAYSAIIMNATKVKLPFSEYEINQLASGHSVTEAADFMQQIIISKTQESELTGLELGSGNGIISLMLALQRPSWKLTGIELQKELHELAVANSDILSVACQFIEGDLRDYQRLLMHKGYALIYSNPPWIKAGSGLVSPDQARAMSRQEVSCTMRDILACIDWCLSDNGTAWVIYPQDRKPDLAREVQRTNLSVNGLHHSEVSPRSFIAQLVRKQAAEQW
jgi:tRNA1(Val) A37 N6-methylase TrmN6